jgi:hypothetical protein
MLIVQRRRVSSYDTDAQNYITAVEAADGQTLETAVKDAINAFVVGCKADGIWSAIKASCILAGARTLAGALVPLVGANPTNVNFVSGDYNRKLGPKGNGAGGASNKRIDTNRNNTADGQNDRHCSVYVTEAGNFSQYMRLIAAGDSGQNGDTCINTGGNPGSSTWIGQTMPVACASQVPGATFSGSGALGFIGMNRASSTAYKLMINSTVTTITQNSATPASKNYHLFGLPSDIPAQFFGGSIAMFTIGSSMSDVLFGQLRNRQIALMAALATAIP